MNMKMKNKYLLALISFLILTGCSGNNGSNSSNNSNSNNSSSEESITDWEDSDKELIKKYCGVLLPFPTGLLNGQISVTEVNDDASGTSFLQIRDTSSSFTLADYHYDLENSGFTGVRDYNNNLEQLDSNGNPYYEFTKIDEKNEIGYILAYSFFSGSETESSCNYIQCYNDFDATSNKANDWSDDEKDGFINFITEVIPFIKLGNRYTSSATDASTISLHDNYAKNLVDDYVSLLLKNGYEVDTKNSKTYGYYCLNKDLEDGASIKATLYYFSGNHFTFRYFPHVYSSTSWPSEFINNYTSKVGITIPSFDADDIKLYSYYLKNGNAYVIAETKDENIESNYLSKVAGLGLFANNYTNYSNWEETLDVFAKTIYDSNNDQVGFGLVLSLTQPTRKFSSSFPSDAISSFLKSCNINDVVVPSLSDISSSKQLKYETIAYDDELVNSYVEYVYEYGQYYYPDVDLTDPAAVEKEAIQLAKENSGVYIYVYDPEVSDTQDSSIKKCLFYEGLTNLLISNSWYKGVNNQDELTFEDKDGKVAITLTYQSLNKVSKVHIYQGSEEKHSPVFKFYNEVEYIKVGQSSTLNYEVNMLPYEISFYSSDENIATVDKNGKVTVSKDASVDDEVIIKASMQVPGEANKREIQCTVKVIDNIEYTLKEAIDKVAQNYNDLKGFKEGDEGYAIAHPFYRSDSEDESKILTFYYLKINFGSMSTEEVKQFVSSNLIPAGFSAKSDWAKNGTIYPEDENENIENEEDKIGYTCDFIDYGWEDKMQISYHVYTDNNGNTMLYVMAVKLF